MAAEMNRCLHCDIHDDIQTAINRDGPQRVVYNLLQCAAEVIAGSARICDAAKISHWGTAVLRLEINAAIEEFTKAGRLNGVAPISEDSSAIAVIKEALAREPPAVDEGYKKGYRAALRAVLADVFAAEGGELSRGSC